MIDYITMHCVTDIERDIIPPLELHFICCELEVRKINLGELHWRLGV